MTIVNGNRMGQKLGNYQLKEFIGQGGFADVYLGEHIHLKTQVAIKVLRPQLASADQQSFLNDSQTFTHLKHPHILPVLESSIEDGIPFLVMRYASHGNLRASYRKHSQHVPITILPYIKQAATALQYTHHERIIHRNIKPENMLLGAQEEILLGDFDLALGTRSSRTQNMDAMINTVAYMAPELLQGRACPASDQYSLGIVLYEWLSGKCPFHGSFTEVARQHIQVPPPAIRAPAVSPEVEAVVLQALAKNPEQRFKSVQAFADAFEQATLEVGGTFRAQPGWLLPGVYQQLQTVVTIEGSPTVRESTFPANVQQPAVTSKGQFISSGTTKNRKRLSKGIAIVLVVLALLVATGGLIVSAIQSGNKGQEQIRVQASATGVSRRYTQVTHGKPFLDDPLTQNINGWDTGVSKDHRCLFKDGAYHVSAMTPYAIGLCSTTAVNVNDFAYQVQMTIVQGDEGGIVFRLTSATKTQGLQTYLFTLNRDGTYSLWTVHTRFNTLLHRKSTAIKAGLNQTNLLSIIAQGKQIALYINKQYVGSVMDTSSAGGQIGLLAENLPDATEVVFSNLQVWRV